MYRFIFIKRVVNKINSYFCTKFITIMKRYLIALILTCFWITTMQAQLLWEISGNRLKQKSYLFATHHLVPVTVLDSIPGVYKAFNQSKCVIGEIVVNDPMMLNKIAEAAQLPNFIAITDLLLPAEYHIVDSALQAVTQLKLSALERLKPAMISNIYLMSLYNRAYPTENQNWQLDSFFQQIAEQKKIPIIGLETIEKQIDLLFNSLSLERQSFLLIGAIKSTQEIEDEIKTINNLYKKGDLNALLSLYQNDTTKYAATQQEQFELLDNRNHEWSKKIPQLIHQKPCFIAVGALHLPGENGLITLLRKAGYRVKPVKNNR